MNIALQTGLGLATALLIAAAACAQTAPATVLAAPFISPRPSPEADGVSQVVTAANVAAWGRAHRDPGAMMMAARILGEVPVRAGPDAPGAAFLTPDALLDEAETFADGDVPTLDAIAFLRDGTRGVRSSPFGQGPIFQVREIKARETYGFELEARGGEVLRVAAIGDGDTNIDMVVRDEDGVLLCQDGSGDHYPVCTVAPAPPSGQVRKMRIDIVNRGVIWTKVQILSN